MKFALVSILIFFSLGCSEERKIDAKEFVNDIKNSIVFIQAEEAYNKFNDPLYREGSGFIITEDGYIATAGHLFWDFKSSVPDKIFVTLFDGKTIPADLLFLSKKEDVAFIAVDVEQPLPILKLSTVQPEQHEPVIIFGYYRKAFFYSVGAFYGSEIHKDFKNSLDTDHSLKFSPYAEYKSYGFFFKGESGGPLVNLEKQVIGLNISYYTTIENRGRFNSVPAKTVLELFKDKIRLDIGY